MAAHNAVAQDGIEVFSDSVNSARLTPRARLRRLERADSSAEPPVEFWLLEPLKVVLWQQVCARVHSAKTGCLACNPPTLLLSCFIDCLLVPRSATIKIVKGFTRGGSHFNGGGLKSKELTSSSWCLFHLLKDAENQTLQEVGLLALEASLGAGLPA